MARHGYDWTPCVTNEKRFTHIIVALFHGSRLRDVGFTVLGLGLKEEAAGTNIGERYSHAASL